MWWLQNDAPPMLPGSGAIGHSTTATDIYVSDFSSRALAGQQLDVLAPGSWVRGPFPSDAGYSHLPWYSRGISDLVRGGPGTNFYWIGGTSMATPHVASVAALMLQKSPGLGQAQVETILKQSALPIPQSGSRVIYDGGATVTVTWDGVCGSALCDAVGAGLIQADDAVAATP
jgi:subtilisin family serine protease